MSGCVGRGPSALFFPGLIMLLRRPGHMILLYLKRGVVNMCVLILISVKIAIQNYQCKIMSFHAQIKVLVFSGCAI